MGCELDIKLLLQHGFLRARCAEEVARRRCRACGCDLVPLGESSSGCPACLTEDLAGDSACRRCGADVAAGGFRACRSAHAYRCGSRRSVPRRSDAGLIWEADHSPFPRPAFAPASSLVQVEWQAGSRRCVIEDARLPNWVAAGILPPDARLRHEGGSRDERVSDAEAFRGSFPNPHLTATLNLAGLTDPALWPAVGHQLLSATAKPPAIAPRSIPNPSEPDAAELAWIGTTQFMPPRLRELAQPHHETVGPAQQLFAAASRAWRKEGGGLGSVLGAVTWAILELALSTLRWELLARWYGDGRIEEARRALAEERQRHQLHRSRVETVHAAWQSLQAQRAIAEAELTAASARLTACRRALAARLAGSTDTRDGKLSEPATEVEGIKLQGFRIEEVPLPGIGPKRLATLAAAGIETAADIAAKRLEQLPRIQGKQIQALLAWRAACVVRIRAEPDMAEAAAELERIEVGRSIEAAVDLQAALLRCLHCRNAGVKRITEAAHIYEDALERLRQARRSESSY
jgi:hypothetical protein